MIHYLTRSLSCVLLALLAVSSLEAHRTGESYIFIRCEENALRGRVEVTLTDLNRAVPLDQNGDGEITAEEFEANYAAVEAYIRQHVSLGVDGVDYPLRFVSHDLQTHSFGVFARFNLVAEGVTDVPDVIEAEYDVLFDEIPGHGAFLVTERNVKTGLEDNEAIPSLAFTPGNTRQSLDLLQPLSAGGFVGFVKHGIHHIWIGIDHILFVLSLVMTAVLYRTKDGWAPTPGFSPAFINLAKVVTLFTVAHTITLSLAALGLVNLPSRIVESVIALSVFLVAVNSIWPIFGERTWIVVFGFGLFHGFGFANVLGYLTQTRSAIVKTLLGFNLGVEIGQLAIIAAAFPLLYLLRTQPIYRRIALPLASAGIAIVAASWFVQRAFEIG